MPNKKSIKVPRLGLSRHGVYYVRYPVVVNFCRRIKQQSLGTTKLAEARVLALQFSLQIAMQEANLHSGVNGWTVNFRDGLFSANGDDDQSGLDRFLNSAQGQKMLQVYALEAATRCRSHLQPLPPVPQLHAVGNQLQSMVASPASSVYPASSQVAVTSLAKAFEMHLAVEKATLTEHTLREKRAVFDDFCQVFGSNCALQSVDAVRITMHWTPAEIQRKNKKDKAKTLGLGRLEKRRGYLAKFFMWAKRGGLYVGESPMQNKIATKEQIRAETKSYAEFTGDDLSKIFSPRFAQEAMSTKPDWYWVPMIALLSGARLSEASDLEVSGCVMKEGVPVVGVRKTALSKRKTKDSVREFPVHSKLIDLGFWDYVETRRAEGAKYLFEGRSSRDAVAKSVGRAWGIWLDRCGVGENQQKVFHSFRSTAITDMHNASASPAAIRKAVGHAGVGLSGVHGQYVRGVMLKALQEAIEALQYPQIDFGQLRLADPTFKAFFAVEEAKKNDPKTLSAAASRARHEQAVRERAIRNAKGQR